MKAVSATLLVARTDHLLAIVQESVSEEKLELGHIGPLMIIM